MTTAESPQSPVAGYPRLGRVAGAVWFLLLAVFYGRALIAVLETFPPGRPSFAAWAPVISRGCTLAFFVTLAWLMMARPAAQARRSGLATHAIALGGTYGVWVVAFLPEAPLSPALSIASATVTLVGSLLIVFTVVHLGRSFSISPQARELVTRGPYAVVRHPLYAAEELAIIGVAMHVVWWAAIPFLLAHLALQIKRMDYEEGLLWTVFPRYQDYARRTARWIPGLW